MTLLRTFLNAALIFSIPNSAVPLSSRSLSAEDAIPEAYQSASQLTDFQPRKLSSSVALMSPSQGYCSSGSTGNPVADIDHEVECFPTGSQLPAAVAKDCELIIDSVILGMKDPLVIQKWGFTRDMDINLSLPKYNWAHETCSIRVKNFDETKVDRFRPVDVAKVAREILRKCVVERKEPLGGNADVGKLSIPSSFYVVVAGRYMPSGHTLRNSTVLSLPSGGPHTIESRASPFSPQENTISSINTQGLEAGERYPVYCFDAAQTQRLTPAKTTDCAFIINEIILRLPNPMLEQTFGFTDAVDINLSKRDNGRWIYGECVVFIKNMDTTSRDRFRYVDVVYTAQRIMDNCIDGTKYALGGTADVGTIEDNFYVAVGGIGPPVVGNGTILRMTSNALASSPSVAIHSSTPSSCKDSGTESTRLDKRSSHITDLLHAAKDFAPPVRCLEPGMPAARKIDLQDCTDAAMVLLHDPKIFLPQPFTTEPTGGIRMPFVQHHKSCYIMIDTRLKLSVSDSIPLLKMVYWALEIMLKCIVQREQAFGGISRLDTDKGIFVSVTGMDPTFMRSGLVSLADEGTAGVPAVSLETSLQISGLGQD